MPPTLLSQKNIDGALVGGASLKADSFFGIVAGVARLRNRRDLPIAGRLREYRRSIVSGEGSSVR